MCLGLKVSCLFWVIESWLRAFGGLRTRYFKYDEIVLAICAGNKGWQVCFNGWFPLTCFILNDWNDFTFDYLRMKSFFCNLGSILSLPSHLLNLVQGKDRVYLQWWTFKCIFLFSASTFLCVCCSIVYFKFFGALCLFAFAGSMWWRSWEIWKGIYSSVAGLCK